RLAWGRWHSVVVMALGITWVLDGLEVTIVAAISGVLEEAASLGLSATQIGFAGTSYIGGAILGALIFGRLTDLYGRKRLFLITLAVYVLATCATALSNGFVMFAICRFVTGMGIGGEYAAINSAIDELIPARVRGFTDLAINGSYWIGTALGAIASTVLLDPRVLGHELGWRAAFGLGALLALAILLVRRHVPESPRWLLIRNRPEEAERIVCAIEARCVPVPDACEPRRLHIVTGAPIGLVRVVRVLFQQYRARAVF